MIDNIPEFKDYRITFTTKYGGKWENWYIDITAISEEDAVESVKAQWYRGHINHMFSIKATEKHPMDTWTGYFKQYYKN